MQNSNFKVITIITLDLTLRQCNPFCGSSQFAGEKQLEDVRQVVEEDDKAETILKGLKAGMTGSNNPGGLWKRIDGDDQQHSKVKKWVRIYEERVGKMYEKHRCRVGGGGIGPASSHNQEFSVEDFDIARLESIDVEEQYKKEKVSAICCRKARYLVN